MQPPTTINVLDSHGGFTAVTLAPTHVKVVRDSGRERIAKYPDDYPNGTLNPDLAFVRWRKVWQESSTLWRPGAMLRKGTTGTLVETVPMTYFQNNNNVTKALYRVPGYRFRIAVWFDNVTGERIA